MPAKVARRSAERAVGRGTLAWDRRRETTKVVRRRTESRAKTKGRAAVRWARADGAASPEAREERADRAQNGGREASADDEILQEIVHEAPALTVAVHETAVTLVAALDAIVQACVTRC